MAVKSYNITDFGPSDLLTSDRIGVRRVSCDSQQTSFEANEQFSFFDTIDAPNNSQIVYKVTIGENAVNLFQRTLNIASGGRRYRAYVAGGGESFTGTLSDVSSRIMSVNSNLRPGLGAHPVTGVTVERAQGADIFDPLTNTLIVGGVTVVTDSNSNRASTAFSPDNIRLGIASGIVLYLVLDGVSGNGAATTGEFQMIYEERFSD